METSSDIQLRVFCRCVLKASLWLVAREILRYQPSAIKTKARQQVLMRFFVSSAPPSLWVGYTPGSHARSAASLAARSSSGCASAGRGFSSAARGTSAFFVGTAASPSKHSARSSWFWSATSRMSASTSSAGVKLVVDASIVPSIVMVSTSISSNCFSNSSIVLEILTGSISLRALPMPLHTPCIDAVICLVRIAVSNLEATASIRLESLK
mmetsp:Transcript_65074/g.130881  ORF Transcript_65074/g.130881 Transcript_65074/m.130881 type:complete len:211 (-) Transcript_65074:253-885(-)